MLYSVLIYDSEAVVEALTEEEESARLERHLAFQKSLRESGKLGPFARLMPTTSAVTLRKGAADRLVLDGPYAETKEHLVGFYLVESDSLDAVVEAASALPLETGSLEIRPVGWFDRGRLEPDAPST